MPCAKPPPNHGELSVQHSWPNKIWLTVRSAPRPANSLPNCRKLTRRSPLASLNNSTCCSKLKSEERRFVALILFLSPPLRSPNLFVPEPRYYLGNDQSPEEAGGKGKVWFLMHPEVHPRTQMQAKNKKESETYSLAGAEKPASAHAHTESKTGRRLRAGRSVPQNAAVAFPTRPSRAPVRRRILRSSNLIGGEAAR
ncbi:Hypothetical predicted protein [Podarcis lilfordi]|uniref:Uncharacterized protein n=1 Tax=Podarcis lilfordi TaxID=74358 RepID=A0AA35KJB3_9SAUR|nr:Hypothetical predicted protein [Podarcis lilfordi]